MSSAASDLVNKVWNDCNLLRDDGVSYGDYVEQLTYLLFLKMDYERAAIWTTSFAATTPRIGTNGRNGANPLLRLRRPHQAR